MPANDALAYQVRFENKSDATAPAKLITVTDVLDPNLDLSTLLLTEIAFADQVIAIPPGLNHYETLLPFTAGTNHILAEVEAALDVPSRTLTLVLRAIDPATGWYPEDPLVGILYPEDGNGRGQGSLSYVVSPRLGVPSGTVITNRASIVFDFNDPINTPLVSNAIDSAAPTSLVLPLPALSGHTFPVNWIGQDDPNGSGIADFDVYAYVDGTNSFRWLTATPATSALFSGAPGHTYAFSVTARDHVGNQEARRALPDTITYVPTNAPVLLTVSNVTIRPGQSLSITNVLLTGTPYGSYQFTLGPGAPAGASINPTNGVFRWTPDCSQASRTNALTVWVTDTGNSNVNDFITFMVAVNECVVPGLGRVVLLAGDSGRVPVNLISTVPLTNLSMTVEAPTDRLTNFWVEPIVPEICQHGLWPLTNNLQWLTLLTCSNQSLVGTQQVAWLHFTAVTNQPSTFVALSLDNTVGWTADGTPVANFAPQSGRVVVLGEQPLLEMVLTTNRQPSLVLYGRPEGIHQVDTSPGLVAPVRWTPWQQAVLTNLWQAFPVPPTDQQRWYRARR